MFSLGLVISFSAVGHKAPQGTTETEDASRMG
jgi:hypothetical protein